MGSGQLLLTGLRALNTFLALRRELGITFDEMRGLMERAEAEGRRVTVEDIEALASVSDEARADLRAEIARQRHTESQ
jgi:hypothetical protein